MTNILSLWQFNNEMYHFVLDDLDFVLVGLCKTSEPGGAAIIQLTLYQSRAKIFTEFLIEKPGVSVKQFESTSDFTYDRVNHDVTREMLVKNHS